MPIRSSQKSAGRIISLLACLLAVWALFVLRTWCGVRGSWSIAEAAEGCRGPHQLSWLLPPRQRRSRTRWCNRVSLRVFRETADKREDEAEGSWETRGSAWTGTGIAIGFFPAGE